MTAPDVSDGRSEGSANHSRNGSFYGGRGQGRQRSGFKDRVGMNKPDDVAKSFFLPFVSHSRIATVSCAWKGGHPDFLDFGEGVWVSFRELSEIRALCADDQKGQAVHGLAGWGEPGSTL